jgi:hypothetical protein
MSGMAVVSPRAAALWLLTAAVLLVAQPASAQKHTPTPSADELWQEYPLDDGSSAGVQPSATPQAAASPRPTASPGRTAAPATTTESDDDSTSLAVLLCLIADAIALLAFGAVLRRRRRAERATTLAGPGQPAARRERKPVHLRPPPDPERAWVAEIEWRSAGGEARFCVVARDRPTAEGTVLARSAPLDWPPSGPDSVPALAAAAERLAATFTDAGWSSLPAGNVWYAKRFAWDPPPPRTGRFGRPGAWPAGADESWRCEIEWRAGHGRARFQAVMYEPGASSGHPIGTSRPFGWLDLDTPDPSATTHQAEVQALVTALEAAGWRRVGQGSNWYAERFVWTAETPPPDRLAPLPAAAEPAP